VGATLPIGSNGEPVGPQRTGRASCAPDSVEQGLRDLAADAGPSVEKLVAELTPGLRALMRLTHELPPAMTREERARALLQYIREKIASYDDAAHPRCKAALMAAFRIPEDEFDTEAHPGRYSSISGRLAVPLQRGEFDVGNHSAGAEAGKRNWNRSVRGLADLIEKYIHELPGVAGWVASGAPSGYQPVKVRRLLVTVRLVGRVVTELLTEREIEALHDGVDRYVVRAYIESSPGATLTVEPVLNCAKGDVRQVNIGRGVAAQKVEMVLPHSLSKGEGCFFATRVTRSGLSPDDPSTWEEIQVTSQGVDSLTMRVQFDQSLPLPAHCWYFSALPDSDRLEPPAPHEGRNLRISELGYVEHRFGAGMAAAKYGLSWSWPDRT
jgi:hypothetical protein